AGMPPALELPVDRPRPAVLSLRGASRGFALGAETLAGLQRLSRQQGATLFMTLLASFAALLQRITGQDDLAVGTPIAGRTRVETEPLIGFFVNTLVARIDLAGDPQLVDLLDRVRTTTLAAYAHQEVPFERLVEALAPERDQSRPPLVQVLFAVQNAPLGPLELPGLALAASEVTNETAKVELMCTLAEAGGGLAGAIEYNRDLFEATTITRLIDRFARLLAGAVADPHLRLSDLPLLSSAENQQALVEWNDTRSAFPCEAGLPELFAAVARETPDAPAVIAGAETWSYRRLDDASNRLARHLQEMGVLPEASVGLSMERSPELILAILAILKAGAVYVPLDPDYPVERWSFLRADTGLELVLVHAATRDRVAGRGAWLVAVDGGEWEGQDAAPLKPLVPTESPAYVIFTSGSTGWPKGVAVPHRAIVRLVRGTNFVHLGPDDRTGHVASISFDAATYEIWGALLNGGAVVVIPREVVLAPAAFAAALREQRVTTMFLTSALFTKMAREEPEAFAGMSELLVGGEAVDPVAARTVLAGRPPRRLLNGYGPTESTTFAAWHPIREVPDNATTVPVGRPLANTTLYVLSQGGQVPPGSVGELAIGGDGLAQGYLNRPELTAEHFVPHPWAQGERLYLTGDLARFLPDGSIELLGRLDNQVKIRGFRIEPGEIEAVLSGHPAVKECAVLARRRAGEIRLVAYAAGQDDWTPEPEELRLWLRQRLPDYMVPAAFVILPSLPLTPNGKLDRKSLPEPEETAGAAAALAGAAGDPVQELVAGIMAEVLRRDHVGLHDDFFTLGGHSLLATQVISRIRQVLGVELLLRELFGAPTVARLAQAVHAARAAQGEEAEQAPPVVPVPREGDLPLSFTQQRLWFLDQLEPGSPLYNIPVAVELAGKLDVPVLAASLGEIVRRHEALRTSFRISSARAGEPVQVIGTAPSPPAPLPSPTQPPAGRGETSGGSLTAVLPSPGDGREGDGRGAGGEGALPLIDLRSLPPTARAAEAHRLSQ